jgi:hypothetical protein
MNHNSVARTFGHTVLDLQETHKVVQPEYHDFLPLYLEEWWQQLLPKQPAINHEINHKPYFHHLFELLY